MKKTPISAGRFRRRSSDFGRIVRKGPNSGMVIVALVTAAVVVVLAVLRVTGIDGNRYTASALATTPYVVVVGALLGGVTGPNSAALTIFTRCRQIVSPPT